MFSTLEGVAPRQGHADWGDTRASKHVGPSAALARVKKAATERLRDGWQETAVGWADAPPAAAATAPTRSAKPAKPTPKVTMPEPKLVAPRKAPPAKAIASARADAMRAVQARATSARLGAWERIAPLVRSAVEIELTALKGTSPLGGSRVGGAPDIPARMKWPEASRPLELVAQVRLEELTAYDVDRLLPRAGLLLFFADLSPASDGYCADGAVLLVEELATVARRPPPDGVALIPESSIEWSATISLPPDGAFLTKARLRGAEVATYNDRVLLPALKGASHRCLGYPTLTEVEDARADEHCILQVASDRRRKLAFGDGQTLRFHVRAAALAKRDFRKVRVSAEEL